MTPPPIPVLRERGDLSGFATCVGWLEGGSYRHLHSSISVLTQKPRFWTPQTKGSSMVKVAGLESSSRVLCAKKKVLTLSSPPLLNVATLRRLLPMTYYPPPYSGVISSIKLPFYR